MISIYNDKVEEFKLAQSHDSPVSYNQIIDSHCHIHFDQFDNDRDAIVANAIKNNVQLMLTVGTEMQSHERILPLIDAHQKIYGSVGIHPCSAKKTYDAICNGEVVLTQKMLSVNKKLQYTGDIIDNKSEMDKTFEAEKLSNDKISTQLALHRKEREKTHITSQEIQKQLLTMFVQENKKTPEELIYEFLLTVSKHNKIIAIGETGLDFYYSADSHKAQEIMLRVHIEVANKLKLPLIIHTRSAEKDTIRVLKEAKAQKIVFHCFTGSMEMAKHGLNLGCLISFSGITTFKNATELREIAKYTPLESILIETDAPYLSPEPNRKIQRNEPSFVIHTCDCIAAIKGLAFAEIAQHTTDNFIKAFFKK
jgi:TatD family hydrolase